MKFFFPQRNERPRALLSALVPFVALVSGCGGGNGATPTATPLPAPTFIGPFTGVPNSPTLALPTTLLKLPSGQIGVLNLTHAGTVAKGTLRVFKGSASDSSLAAGLYPVVGAFAAPITFNVQNQSVGDNRFSLSGNLPQNSQNGSFDFSIGKIKGTSVLLTPNGGLLPRSTPYLPVGDLQFSNFTSPNTTLAAPLAVTPTGDTGFKDARFFSNGGAFYYEIIGDKIIPRVDLQATRPILSNPQQALNFEVNLFTSTDASKANPNLLSVGQSFNLTPGVTTFGVSPRVFATYAGRSYNNQSGTMTIESIGAEFITLRFNNVTLATDEVPSSRFVVNGTFSASGLLTVIKAQ